MTSGDLLDALTQQRIPVVSVAIGRLEDRATWRIDYAKDATAEQRAAGEALKLVFDPDRPPAPPAAVLTKGAFADLFTPDEDKAIARATTTDEDLAFFYRRLQLADAVHLDNPHVVAGLAMLVAKKLITDDRRTQILANVRPA